ncbi:choice-of-anchor I domain-containing protein [Verrucomicrobiota bacterium sgz303538]
MKPTARFLALSIATLACATPILHANSPHRISLEAIGSVAAGSYNASAAEIPAYDPGTKRLFVVNAQLAHIDVISITDPRNPKIVDTINVKAYGAVANSVAVRDGIVAVAVENAVKTSNGKVVFFDTTNLKPLAAVEVGALPDMLTFSPDGRYVLVANEGEPSLDYTADPEGSVSIIDLSSGVKKLTQKNVRTARFTGFDKQKLLNAGIRIFGPGASVAQDLEPEYIAVSKDSKTAWVTLQENNAIATVDIATATVKELLPLGYKDHSAVTAAATLYKFDLAQLPTLGVIGSETISLGGFSGLHFEGIDPVTGRYKFVSNTDRGPNAEPTGVKRPFLLPDFSPEIVRFELDPATGKLTLTQRIPLKSAPGVPLTGLPNTAIAGGDGNSYYNDEVPVDLLGNVLPLDRLGADLEGIVVDPKDGSFWMVDEYRPAIYHFNSAGVLIDRFVPQGTAAAAGQPEGTFGKEVLPSVLAGRRQNRGFEGVALDGGKIYAFVQSPVRNPGTLSNAALTAMRNIRIVELDPATLKTKQYIYVMDNADLGAGTNTRADKIGDAASFGNGEFLVIERDDDKVGSDDPSLIEKKIYRFNLAGATDVTGKDGLIGTTGKTVDQLTIAEMVSNGIRPVEKILHVDLNAAGYNNVEKVEGLTIIDPWTVAVINDNDFGTANITINPDGTFVRNYTPEAEQLGIINVRLNGIDASDRDSKINIRQWPVKGMFMPDGIATVAAGATEYLITANEGDAREYIYKDAAGNDVPAYVEALRVGDSKVVLDPVRFPNAAVLKNNANLGRLNISTAMGRNPDGSYKELYAFGARSFSVWTTKGELVYDSGEDIEWITAQTPGVVFNASNTNNDFDNRSDDKGPEPEGVVVGKAFGCTYAFIGLERVGGVMVYDVSDPVAPEFVQYLNFRDFTQAPESPASGDLGPEGLVFIPEENSPNGKPLLVTANEISGTTTVYEISKAK